MALSDVIPAAKAFSRLDKLRLIRELADDLSATDDIIPPDRAYPVWSPHDAFAAADTLLRALTDEKRP
jgi:hypothetical protein